MNEEIVRVLRYFNLSEAEAKVYLACLKIGQGTSYEIAKEANLKRPTVYVLVDGLFEKGLVTTRFERGKTLVQPVAPRRLVETWKGRVEALEAIQPDLNLYFRQSQVQPNVQVFEGEKGVDAVYNQLPPLESKGEEVILFGSMEAVLNGFEYLVPRWERAFRNKRNPIRELINDEPGALAYLKKRQTFDNPNYQLRVVHGQPFGKTDNIIWQNKLAIFSLNKELFVTLIESEEIVKTYRALFESAWLSARVVR